MAKSMEEIKNKNSVVKSNSLIEARYKLSLSAQRVLLSCALKVKPTDDFSNTLYKVFVEEYKNMFGLDNNDIYEELRTAIDKLWESHFTIIDKDGVPIEKRWIISRKRDKRNNYVGVVFHNDIKEFIHQVKTRFTEYKIENVAHLKSSHSIRIYELLKQYVNIGKRKFEYEELRKILAISESEYELFGDFNRRILKQSQRELKENSDINFEYKFLKTGKKVTSIQFFIFKQEGKSQMEIPGLERPAFEHQEIFDTLVSVGITPRQAEKFFVSPGIEQITRNLFLFEKELNSGNIKDNPKAWLFKAISEDFAFKSPNEIKIENEKKMKQEAQKTIERNEEIIDMLHSEYSEELRKKAGKIISEFSEEELEKNKISYKDGLSDFQRKLFGDSVSNPGFLIYIQKHYLTEEERSIEEFAKSKKVPLSKLQMEIKEAQEFLGVVIKLKQ